MAKAKSTATKAPVAGQPGYDPSEVVVTEQERDMGPEPIRPKAQRPESGAAKAPAKEATAAELVEYLIGSGSNPLRLADSPEWIRENPAATAEQCYRRLEAARDANPSAVAEGTLLKAGKWIWGPSFTLESAVLLAPAEEIGRLRGHIEALEKQLAMKNADLVGTQNQNGMLQDRLAELQRQVGFLSAGRSQEDLAAAGVGAGENSLVHAH